MLDRARIQPDPVVYLAMVAQMMRLAAAAPSLPALFLALEEAGTMLRIDRSVTPTMAKAPTLGRWELDLLRSVEHVVRLGRVRTARRGRLDLDDGSVALADDALVVHCAADGLKQRPPAADLGAGGHHAAAGTGGLPLLRRGPGRLGRGDPRRRRGEEPAVPAVDVRQLADGLGADERPRPARRGRVRVGARREGVDRPGRDQPRARAGRGGSPALDVVLAELAEAVPPGVARLDQLSSAGA